MDAALKQERLLILKDRTIDYSDRTLVMGILNVTPDSFSDGGNYDRIEQAILHAREMIEAGIDIIDIGGESTRPGADFVPLDIELERVVPVIKAIREFTDIPISIDTYKAETAKQAILAGADIINDIWGAKADTDMPAAAAELDVPIILMHNRDNREYTDLMEDMKADLAESINLVKKAGVRDEHIILDPGIGFAKDYKQNLEAMRRLEELNELGYPILLGTSRKAFIGKVLDEEVGGRMEGTGATVCLGIAKGSAIVRVHDVEPIVKMVKMMDAMLYKGGDFNG